MFQNRDTAISTKQLNPRDSSHLSTISTKSINILPKINQIKKQNTITTNNNRSNNPTNVNNNNFYINNVYNLNKSFVSKNETKKKFLLFENIDLSKRNVYFNYYVNNNYIYPNLNYFYNINNIALAQNYLFINDTLVYIATPRVPLSNSLIFSPV